MITSGDGERDKEKRLLTDDNPTRMLERIFLTVKGPKLVYFFVILQL